MPSAPLSHPGPGEATTRELVLSAAAGSTRAFHRLADRYQEAVFRMIFYRVRSRMDAEDLSQEVFLRAFRHLPRLEDPERFRSWLFSIALNRVRDFMRRQQLRRFFGAGQPVADAAEDEPTDSGATDGLARLARRQFWDAVAGILAGMSAAEREVFRLRFLDQLEIVEIADILKKGESTVKTHLYRAIAKFKAHPDAAGLAEALP